MSLMLIVPGIIVVAGVYVIVKLSTPSKAEREAEINALIEKYMKSERRADGDKKHLIDGVEVEVDKDGYIKKSW